MEYMSISCEQTEFIVDDIEALSLEITALDLTVVEYQLDFIPDLVGEESG